MTKMLFVVWTANKGIFTHILMNLIDLNDKGHEVGLVFESEGCKLIKDYYENKNDKFEKIKELKLITSVCKVCAKSMGSLEIAEEQGLPIHDDLFGHTPLEKWISQDYQIISV